MKNLKKLAATLTLTGIIMMGVSSAKAGILLGDLTGTDSQPCTTTNTASGFTGIIVNDFIGIIVNDVVGIIIADSNNKGCSRLDHGILLGD